MPYVLIKNGKVVQKRSDYREGFIKAPDYVVPEFLYNEKTGKFSAPDISPTTEEKVQTLKNELKQIDNTYNTDRGIREFIINNSDKFNKNCVIRMQEAENKAQKFRDKLNKLQ